MKQIIKILPQRCNNEVYAMFGFSVSFHEPVLTERVVWGRANP